MANESDFHPGFLKLVSDAFTLVPNLTSRRIYNMYGGAGPTTNFNEGVLDAFLNNLIVIKNQSANVMQIEVQGFPDNNHWDQIPGLMVHLFPAKAVAPFGPGLIRRDTLLTSLSGGCASACFQIAGNDIWRKRRHACCAGEGGYNVGVQRASVLETL